MIWDIPVDDPDFDLHADQRGRIIASLTAILVITTVTVALRILSRHLARAGFWWDDHLAIIAWAVNLSSFILWFIGPSHLPSMKSAVYTGVVLNSHLALRYGFGRHIYIFGAVEGAQKARSWLKILWTFELIFHTITTLAKYSVSVVPQRWQHFEDRAMTDTLIVTNSLAFYYRIFPVPAFRRTVIWVAIVCTLYTVAIDLTIVFQCQPLDYAWNRAFGTVEGHCINVDTFFIASGSCNTTLNIIVFILPIPLLWRLRTTAKQQIVLTIIFTLAGFVLVVSIIWIVVLARLEQADVTWNFINAVIWSVLEPSMAVVCACIPSLRPLYSVAVGGFRNVTSVSRSKIMSSSGGGGGASGGNRRTSWRPTLSRSRMSDAMFSQLEEEQIDDPRPLGHGVSISGGRRRKADEEVGEGMELPLRGIHVTSEVSISTEKLEYKDRLF
ncbi:MAG: hypothetical protein Q9206_003284 [Seirophora lacunosa]